MIQARLISRGGGCAQVVTYIGEGSQRRSVTRHVRLEGGSRWMGCNPDEAAIAQLDAAENDLLMAKGQHESAEQLAKLTIKDIERIRREGRMAGLLLSANLDPLEEVAAKTIKAALKQRADYLAAILKAIETQVKRLRTEIPRKVQFSF